MFSDICYVSVLTILIFVILSICLYFYNNPHMLKKIQNLQEGYQNEETNYESCINQQYPRKWCLKIPEPYSILNKESVSKC